MADFYAGGIVYEIRVDDKSGIGIAKAEGNLKKFEHETNKTGTNLKSLSRETSILGGSLASLGGTAMIAGTAIGGDFGSALQSAGMGVAFVGSGISTLVPAMKTLSVVAGETIIPALKGIGAAAYTALGPLGLLALGIGAAVGAYYLVNQALSKNTSLAYDNKVAVGDLKQAYKELYDLQKEYAGIPEELSDLELGYADALISAQEATEAKEEGTLDKKKARLIEEQKTAAIPALQAQEAINKAQEAGATPLQIKALEQQRDEAMKVVADYQKQIDKIDQGIDNSYAKLTIAEKKAWDLVDEYTKKIEEKKARKAEISPLVPQIYAGTGNGKTYYEEAIEAEQAKKGKSKFLSLPETFTYLTSGKLPEEPEPRPQMQYYAQGAPTTPGPARVGDLIININGTITDQSFKIPGNTLKDQTSAQGYTW
jgi:hypothetical protein